MPRTKQQTASGRRTLSTYFTAAQVLTAGLAIAILMAAAPGASAATSTVDLLGHALSGTATMTNPTRVYGSTDGDATATANNRDVRIQLNNPVNVSATYATATIQSVEVKFTQHIGTWANDDWTLSAFIHSGNTALGTNIPSGTLAETTITWNITSLRTWTIADLNALELKVASKTDSAADGTFFASQLKATVKLVTNAAPTASAGPDQTVREGATVQLNATASTDPEGASLTYQWNQIGSPAVTLSSVTSATPTFTAPLVSGSAILHFSVEASDGTLDDEDDVYITVEDNAAPLVDAGPDQSAEEGTTVQLAGSASDPDDDSVTLAWTQTLGDSVTLSSTSSATPSFTAPEVSAPTQLTFRLRGSDGLLTTDDHVSINITLRDEDAPVLDADASCSEPGEGDWCWGAWSVNVTASDADSGVSEGPTCWVDDDETACADIVISGDGTHYLNASATDAAGNEGVLNATYDIDSTDPTPSLSLSCDDWGNDDWCTATSSQLLEESTDATSGIASVTCLLDGEEPLPCTQIFEHGVGSFDEFDVEITVVDNAGHEATDTLSVQIDVAPPTFSAPALDLVEEALTADGQEVEYTAPEAEDDGSGLDSVDCSPASGAVFRLGRTEVTCTATDVAGLQNNLTFSVTIEDTSAPSITPMLDLIREADSPDGRHVEFSPPSTLDAVDGEGVATCDLESGQYPLGATTVNCTATDAAGNEASIQFDIIVRDTTAPDLGAAPDLEREAEDADGATVSYDAPSATDLVDEDVTVVCDIPSGSVFPLGPTQVECSAEDAAGNSNSTTFTITVVDTTGPTIDDMDPIVAEATSSDGASVDFDAPAIDDAVDGAGVASCTHTSGMFPIGETPVTCSAEDAAGNAATNETFTVTVEDSTAPSFGEADDIRLEADNASGRIVEYAAPSASDAVDAEPDVVCAPASGSLFPLGSTEVECSAEDEAGNSNTTSFQVIIEDTTAPTIDAVDDQLVEATGPSGALVAIEVPATSDAVDGPGLAVCDAETGVFPLGPTLVSCSAEDAAGNAADNETFTITVEDTTAPDLPGRDDVYAEADNSSGKTVEYDAPAASDLVDEDVSVECGPASGSLFPLGSSDVLCSALDDAGNGNNTTFHVIILDSTAPTIDPADNVTAEATGPDGADVDFAPPATNDAVDGPGIAVCDQASGVFPLGDTLVTCSAEDAAGNAAINETFTITVEDTTAPTIDALEDQLLEATGPDGAAASFAPASHDDVDGDQTPDCDAESGATFPLGVTTVRCNIEDAAGNAADEESFTITVVDSTAPNLTVPDDAQLEATSGSGAVFWFNATATDIVDAEPLVECNAASGSYFPVGDNHVGCEASDDEGNLAAAGFWVNVTDSTPPTLDSMSDLGAEATGPDGAVVEFTAPATHDIVDGDGTADCSPASGSTFPLGNTTVECTGTDNAGNHDNVTFQVRVVDTTAPVIDEVADQEYPAEGPEGAVVDYALPNATDLVDGVFAASCDPAPGSTFPIGTTLVTCNAEDAAGNNATSESFNITISDHDAPGLSLPETMNATAALGTIALVEYAASAWDAVWGETPIECDPASPAALPVGIHVIECSATDASGNTATGNFSIEVGPDGSEVLEGVSGSPITLESIAGEDILLLLGDELIWAIEFTFGSGGADAEWITDYDMALPPGVRLPKENLGPGMELNLTLTSGTLEGVVLHLKIERTVVDDICPGIICAMVLYHYDAVSGRWERILLEREPAYDNATHLGYFVVFGAEQTYSPFIVGAKPQGGGVDGDGDKIPNQLPAGKPPAKPWPATKWPSVPTPDEPFPSLPVLGSRVEYAGAEQPAKADAVSATGIATGLVYAFLACLAVGLTVLERRAHGRNKQ